MKTLAKLFLITGIGLSSLSLSAQNFKVPHETDPYKFVPKGALTEELKVKGFGDLIGTWYDKDCKTEEDYFKKWVESNGIISINKIFLDFDGDGILDSSIKGVVDLYFDYLEEQELKKTSM
jgi:hypothetical protein